MSDEKLWDTCHNRAALLRSDRQHTSPRWDRPLPPPSFQTLAPAPAGKSALSQVCSQIWELVLGAAPLAAGEALAASRCCCRAGWSQRWTGPVGNDNAEQ